jgi:hypothetical protein
MVETIYKGRIGHIVSLTLLEPAGTPISLTSATVTLVLKKVGSDVQSWSHACTVDDAANGLAHYDTVSGDFDTTGEFYSLVTIAYTGGNTRTETGPKFTVIENDESVVTVSEFLQFLDIPSTAAKDSETCRMYILDAETLVNAEIPTVDTSTAPNFIRLKKTLVKLKAGILYFMNSDESLIDPTRRNSKIELWTKQFNGSMQRLVSVLSATSTGKGIARRVKDSSYTNESSYLYETDVRS